MINPHELIDLLIRALEAAPAPVDGPIASVHPEDVQKWSERYRIWYTDVRCHILDELADQPKNNLYYQIDRLIQESKAIQNALNQICSADKTTQEQPKQQKQTQQKGIVIGTIKKS